MRFCRARNLIVLTFALSAGAATGSAQTFEVASVRADGGSQPFFGSRIGVLPGGRFEAHATLRQLIAFAYGLQPYQRVDGSAKILDERFVILATSAKETPNAGAGHVGPLNLMLRALLVDRFRLAVRVANEDQDVYLLKLANAARLGPRLHPTTTDC